METLCDEEEEEFLVRHNKAFFEGETTTVTQTSPSLPEGSTASYKALDSPFRSLLSGASPKQPTQQRVSRWEVKQPAGVRLTWGPIQSLTPSSTVSRLTFCLPNSNEQPISILINTPNLSTSPTGNTTTTTTFSSSSSSSSSSFPSPMPSPLLLCSLHDSETTEFYLNDDNGYNDANGLYLGEEDMIITTTPYRPPSPFQSIKGKEKDYEEEMEEEEMEERLLFRFDDEGSGMKQLSPLLLSLGNHHNHSSHNIAVATTGSFSNLPRSVGEKQQPLVRKEKGKDDSEEDDMYDESMDEDERPLVDNNQPVETQTQSPFVMLENIRQTQLKAHELLQTLLDEDASSERIHQVSEELDKLSALELHYLNICSRESTHSKVMRTTFNEEDFSCPICWSDIVGPDARTLAACDHRYCKECLGEHFTSKIREAQVLLKCPHPECDAAPEVYELEYLLDREIYHKYLEFAVIANLKTDKNAKWCPTLGCGNVIVADPDLSIVKCFSCKKEFCFHCLKWHPGRACTDAIFEVTSEEDRQFMQWLDNVKNDVHSCPRCNISIEKNQGCNHMQCTSCKYQFCWLCGKEYTAMHYNEGECAGKQFIEPPNEAEIPPPIAPPLVVPVEEQLPLKKTRKGKLSRVVGYVALGIAAPPLLVLGMPIVIYKAVKKKNAKKAAANKAVE